MFSFVKIKQALNVSRGQLFAGEVAKKFQGIDGLVPV
jgi:hypothetical protein